MTIKELIAFGMDELSNTQNPRLDSELIIGYVLQKERLYLILNLEESIEENKEKKIKEYLSLRKSGTPIHYILKEREFMGMDFLVEKSVLIPRPDTEILVEELIKELKDSNLNEKKDILGIEIGPGSGIISISLLKEFSNLKIIACDINPSAIELTRKNSIRHGVKDRLDVREGSLFHKIEGNIKADFIVSNPPYIKKDVIKTLQIEIREHEPLDALDGGEDGLDFYRAIVRDGSNFLNKGGIMAFEIGYDQGEAVKTVMNGSGYEDISVYKDLAGLDRVVIGRKI
ncbi:release factor glutamine methyltransferase [Acetoanaerobium pronyense]|uniref:Release factor glutamine methyltransferase n=1 Tax=Acetoanaerobium pronyense TaxID=1482736 RepID=A0ABS4KL95_9FIRM|nr:peptide chain release factor N(5)-glutamine methyltransferase [Acetoanaerobium pronyense]MBP2027996.1 release factor glutamine methyltransferase [Acetoanaerobium pronyense]